MTTDTVTAFNQLALTKPLLSALDAVGYETPSPIQAQTIPLLLQGRDVLGQAQTGTGKTAAFALPLLSGLDLKQKYPQILVLAPTRELAIQVAEAFQKYASHMKSFHVLPIYGGQDYRTQIRALERGVHVVVGTPGRVMDHMRRGTLKLHKLSALVLDEADEMLRMGFIDDVEWILEQTPPERQIALFSATMPQQIRRIAGKYLNDPEQITIKSKTTTVDTIRQRFWPVSGVHKLDALTRILEAEAFDGMIVFVRTKTSTVELSEKLEARGYASAPLNGDIPQNQRERTIDNLKKGKLDIIVATDVAARGLDVERISHVVNYDIPYDTEAYVHRIGRTGRAGRKGDAILFVAPREKRLLGAIEKATRQKIEMMELPSTELINDKRVVKFKQRISDTLANEDLGFFSQLVEQYQQEHNVPAIEIAAALAQLLQGDTPFLLQHKPERQTADRFDREESHSRKKPARKERDRSARKDSQPEAGMDRFRIEVGRSHGVQPGNIVGAIANEAGIESQYIGRINIHDDYSLVDLPEGMPKEIFNDLKYVWVSGQQLRISRLTKDRKPGKAGSRPKAKGKIKVKSRPDDKHKSKKRSKNKVRVKSARKSA
ncbi:MAG: DEAD/DEAH box helicase [Gammaproteobacteria bacterium]|jgi:ATP-dependent RNA helicase DeaD